MSRKRKFAKPRTEDLLIEVRLSPEDQERIDRLMYQEREIHTAAEALLWALRRASEPVSLGETIRQVFDDHRHNPQDLWKVAAEHPILPGHFPQVTLEGAATAQTAATLRTRAGR